MFRPILHAEHRSIRLSRKKTTVVSPPPRPAAPVGPLLPARFCLPVAIAATLLAAVCIVSTYHNFATTSDEPAHIACGLEYVANHVYHYESQHPPLARAMVALLPYLSGTRPRGQPTFQLEGWDVITYQRHPDLTLTLMRLGVLPFFLLACHVTFYWARHHFGASVAAIATVLFTLVPPVLAHAGLATTDLALTSCLALAFFSLILWAEQPTTKRALLAGFACALAVLSKFTALGFLPAAVFFALLAWIAAERPSIVTILARTRERAPTFGIAVATGVFTIWAVYLFSPGPFFDGIRVALTHNRNGHPSWLLGQRRVDGWWYYFPVALGVKTPLVLLLLFAGGLVLVWKQRARVEWLLPAAFCLGVLLPALNSRIDIGVRHVMPFYIGLSIIAALAVEWLLRKQPILPALLVLYLAIAVHRNYPDYIPYFNELVQGPPDRVLVDSDYDWGQDTKRLAARLHELGATQLNYGFVDSPDNHFLETYPGLPHITNIDPRYPAPGWTAVRPTLERIEQYGLQYNYPNLQPWFDYMTPREHVGTMLLYYLPPGAVPKAP